MKPILFLISLLIVITSCNSKKVNSWATDIENKAPQILLTNKIHFKNNDPAFGYYASSFLLEYKNITRAISAKHLLQGYEPEINQSNFNSNFNSWIIHPRALENLSKHNSASVSKLININESEDDILIFEINSIPDSIFALLPVFEKPNVDEELILIGCSYSEIDCTQNFYRGKFKGAYNSVLNILETKGNFNFRGYSGAPIINKKGFCIGVLYGGIFDKENNNTKLLYTPISFLEKNTLWQ